MGDPGKVKLLNESFKLALEKKRVSSLTRQHLSVGFLHFVISVSAYTLTLRAPSILHFLCSSTAVVTLLQFFGYALAVCFFTSAVLNFYLFLKPRIFPAMNLGKRQLSLLGITQSEPGFQELLTPVKKEVAAPSRTLMSPAKIEDLPLVPVELSNVSWTSSPVNVSHLSSADSFSTSLTSLSPNLSNMTASSWTFRRGSEASTPGGSIGLATPTSEGNRSSSDLRRRKVYHSKSLLSISQVDEGIDYDSLQKTSQLMNELERQMTVGDSFSPQPKPTYAGRSNFGDFSPIVRGGYQLATSSPVSGLSGKVDESSKAAASHRGDQIWKTLGISDECLRQWRENIRSWLCQSVLRRLVSEIDKVNDILSTHGMSDSHIGHASLEKLRKTAQIPSIHHYVPSFDDLLPYLEITTNQEYLVKRLQELSVGGCISQFRWNSGGSFKGKPWDESLPTDSQLLMHILSVYLNSCLPVQSDRPDKKSFTGRHYFSLQDKPSKVEHVAVVEEKLHPPAFYVMDKENTWELTKGRNNFFDSVLLFFYLVQKKSDGILGRMVLHSAGLNIAWVFQDTMEL